MAARYRVKPRFFLLLAVVGLLVAGVLCLTLGTFGPPRVAWGSLGSSRQVTLLLVRDETVIVAGEYAAGMETVAQEGDRVQEMDSLLHLHTAAWNPRDAANLTQLEQQIRDIQENDILKGTADASLDAIDRQIQQQAEELNRYLLQGNTQAAYTAKSKLGILLQQRITYLRQNVTADDYLRSLYDTAGELSNRLYGASAHFASPRSGVVSYSCDGLEEVLTPEALKTITAEAVEGYLEKRTSSAKTFNGNGQITPDTNLCRVVNTVEWYACMVQPTSETALEQGRVYEFALDGCDATVMGEVSEIRVEGRKRLVLLRFTGEMGNLLRMRRVEGAIGTHNKGYIVPQKAIWKQDGQTMVTLNLDGQRMAVPVTILTEDTKQAMIQEAEGYASTLRNGAELILP